MHTRKTKFFNPGCRILQSFFVILHLPLDSTNNKNRGIITKKYTHAELLIEKKCVTLRRLYASVAIGIESLTVICAARQTRQSCVSVISKLLITKY